MAPLLSVGVAELGERADLDLADALAGDGEALRDLGLGDRRVAVEAEAHAEDVALAVAESRGEEVGDVLVAVGLLDELVGGEDGLVLEAVGDAGRAGAEAADGGAAAAVDGVLLLEGVGVLVGALAEEGELGAVGEREALGELGVRRCRIPPFLKYSISTSVSSLDLTMNLRPSFTVTSISYCVRKSPPFREMLNCSLPVSPSVSAFSPSWNWQGKIPMPTRLER